MTNFTTKECDWCTQPSRTRIKYGDGWIDLCPSHWAETRKIADNLTLIVRFVKVGDNEQKAETKETTRGI